MRHANLLNAPEVGLVVVDLQEKLVNMVHNREELLDRCALILELAKIYDIPTVLTEHYPQGLGYTVDEVKEHLPVYEPVVKRIFSCCGVEEFVGAVQAMGKRQLVVVGIETHICVSQTVHDLLARDYQVHVIADACGTRFLPDHLIGIEKMRGSGAVIASAEMAVYEMVERADTEQFKQVLKLVK
jgi:nicotinamidase-related amidase